MFPWRVAMKPDKAMGGEKLRPELMHGQIQGFARLLHAIKAMSAGQLKGA